MTSFDLTAVLDVPKLPSYLKQIDHELKKTLGRGNPRLAEPASRLIDSGSKRLRPSLVIASAESLGIKIDAHIISACAAVELVHLGSLAHDDIIDKADTRWNAPTIYAKEGLGSALIAGDYLLAEANLAAAGINAQTAQLIASTIIELCEGQAGEFSDLHDTNRSMESLNKAIAGKTAALISTACQIGGFCAGLTDPRVKALAAYGRELGMAFQLIDDVLDVLSTAELMGKPVGKDARSGVYTMPLLLSLRGPNNKAIRDWFGNQQAVNADLARILLADGSIEKTLIRVRRYNQSARKALADFGKNSAADGLKNLPDAYLKWAMAELVAAQYRPAAAGF